MLRPLVPEGIEYGTILLVEFEPQSCWYELSNALAVEALNGGAKVDVHLFQHRPEQVRQALKGAGLDVAALEATDHLRVIDSYTVQVGIGSPEKPAGNEAFLTESVRVANWSVAAKRQIVEGIAASEKERLHIDENISILARYNTEEEIVDYWRTRAIPRHKERRTIFVNAVALGVATEWFQLQFEAMADGILDCRTREQDGRLEHQVRLRRLRGRASDTRWRRVRVDRDLARIDEPS
jgi:KaiC/GvpD/RAD55 family RecA-like ATPase